LYKKQQQEPLKQGDIVKIDLGCHIDGYICVAAHTCVVPDGADTPVTSVPDDLSRAAVAAYHTMLVAARGIAAGATNTDVTAAVERVAKSYNVSTIQSVRMHQMKRYVLDGVKEVALKTPTPEEEQLEKCTFEQHEVYAVDVAVSTGDGNARPGDTKTTIFKRTVDEKYSLKLQAARHLLAEVDKHFPTLPFTLRHLQDVRKAKLGIPECLSHGLLTPYATLHEHSGTVAHFKCTVLLLPSGTLRVTGLDLPEYFKTDVPPDEETAKVLKEMEEEILKKAARKAAKKKKSKAKK
jgi:curved DNA binding protein